MTKTAETPYPLELHIPVPIVYMDSIYNGVSLVALFSIPVAQLSLFWVNCINNRQFHPYHQGKIKHTHVHVLSDNRCYGLRPLMMVLCPPDGNHNQSLDNCDQQILHLHIWSDQTLQLSNFCENLSCKSYLS